MQRKPSIALAHDHLFQVGGAEQVLRELVDLYPEAPLYTLIYNRKNFGFFNDVTVHTSLLQKLPGGVNWFKWYLGLMPYAWEQFDFSSYDVVISSSSAFVKGIKTTPRTIHISYCHTPTRYLWSDSESYVSQLNLPQIAQAYLLRLFLSLRLWDHKAAQQVNYFVANSQHVAKRIRTYYGRESTVIYPPINTARFKTADSIEDYYVIVSRLRPYKRVDMAIETFNNLKLPLVIIGGGEEMGKLKKMAKKNITFLGEISDEKRNHYLSRCRAFIHPQEEDFGMSAVEAMASGRPVIAYNAGGAQETVKNELSGVLFDEQSWEALAYAILNFNYKEYSPQNIRNHALQFDTSVFQKKMSTFIDQVTGTAYAPGN